MIKDTGEERLKQLTVSGNWVMKFAELEGKPGEPTRSISFVGIEFKPLDYRTLADAQLHLPVTVPLDWRNAKIIECDIAGMDIDAVVKGNAVLESILSSSTIGLLQGGWLPSGLAVTRPGVTILLDRNVVGQIRARYEDGTVIAESRDFLDLLAELEIRINPLLFAIEGNGRGIPAPSTVKAQLEEAVQIIEKALPKATIAIGERSLEGVLGLIEDARAGLARKQAFLLEIAPSLTPPTSHRLLDAKWQEVLDAADGHGVRRNALVVLAALSAVAVPNSGSPAKKLLKFRSGYSTGDAYNALADLRSLEILSSLLAMFPEERPALFTADKALALFWVGMRAHNFRQEANGTAFNLAPVENLLPRNAINRWREAVSRK